MKELKDFNTEKSIYIGKVLNHIHYKKLHSRIYEEISNHMDDMYEDFNSTCDDEEEITRKVLEEMGNPYALGQQLKAANKSKLFWAKTFKIILVLAIIPVLISCVSVGIFIIDEVMVYFQAKDVATIETQISEQCNYGEPVRLLTEIESNGFLYKFYVPQKQNEDNFKVFYAKSIKIFGISTKNRFGEYGGGHMGNSSRSTDAVLLITEVIPSSDYDCLFFFSKPSETKYIKIFFEPFLDNDVEPYWSDFIEIPQNATADNPKWILIECPDGYEWNKFEKFDENKEPID